MRRLKLQHSGHLMQGADSWKRPWCWERLRAGGEGDDRGWDGWMASPIQRTWIWASSERWWRTRKPGALQSMGSQRVGHNWATEQQVTSPKNLALITKLWALVLHKTIFLPLHCPHSDPSSNPDRLLLKRVLTAALIFSQVSNGSETPKLDSLVCFSRPSTVCLPSTFLCLSPTLFTFLEICFKYISTFVLWFILFLHSRLLPLSSNKCFLKSPNPCPQSRTFSILFYKNSFLISLAWHDLLFRSPRAFCFSPTLSYSFCSISHLPVQAGLLSLLSPLKTSTKFSPPEVQLKI